MEELIKKLMELGGEYTFFDYEELMDIPLDAPIVNHGMFAVSHVEVIGKSVWLDCYDADSPCESFGMLSGQLEDSDIKELLLHINKE